jgi:predicted RNase H-like HicB family nuclease
LLVTSQGFPELTSFGEDHADALRHAADAITGMIESYMYRGLDIPSPRRPSEDEHAVVLPAFLTAKVALYRAMREDAVTSMELARHLGTTAGQVRKLLDPATPTRLADLERALGALGRGRVPTRGRAEKYPMRRYVALLDQDRTGGYGVAFPDFPGCTSAGDTLTEAIDQGAQALRMHVEGMIEDGETIPEPRSAEALRQRQGWWDFAGAIVALVPLLPPSVGVERLNISLDRSLVREIDRAAKSLGMSRSAFLAAGAERLLVDAAAGSAPAAPAKRKTRFARGGASKK